MHAWGSSRSRAFSLPMHDALRLVRLGFTMVLNSADRSHALSNRPDRGRAVFLQAIVSVLCGSGSLNAERVKQCIKEGVEQLRSRRSTCRSVPSAAQAS
jgi:hypothetical protein